MSNFALAGSPVSDGLAYYFTFDTEDSNSTHTFDIVNNKVLGLYNNPPQVSGRIDEAYMIITDNNSSTPDQYLYGYDMPLGNSSDEFTINFWYKQTMPPTASHDFPFEYEDTDESNAIYWEIGVYNSTGIYWSDWYVYNTTYEDEFATYDYEATPFDCNWHYITIQRNATYWNYFIDAQLVNSTVRTGYDITPLTNIAIGDWWGGNSNYNKTFDEVSVYNRALSPSEINQNYLADSNTIVFDTTPPIVTLSSPVNLSQTLDTTPDFTFKATDDVASSMTCTLYIDGNSYGSVTATNNTQTTITASSSLSNGDHNWYINCSDGTNIGQSETRTIGVGSHFSRCGHLIDSGTYYLDSDIINYSSRCIYIDSSSITLDCGNHLIDGQDNDGDGIYVNQKSNVIIQNCSLSDWKGYAGIRYYKSSGIIDNVTVYSCRYGVFIDNNCDVEIKNSIIYDNSPYGIYSGMSSSGTIHNNIIYDNGEGIHGYLSKAEIRGNRIYGNNGGIGFDYSGGLIGNGYIVDNFIYDNNYFIYYTSIIYISTDDYIYNNFLNNTHITNNFNYFKNHLNKTLQSGTPIYTNGNLIGGNYWAKPDGTGYSETCADTDFNGICDEPYNISGVFDYLPLTNIPYILDVTSPEEYKTYKVGYVTLSGTSSLNGDLTYSFDGGSNQTLCTDCNSFSTSVYSEKGTHEICVYGYESDDTNNNDYECITYYSKNTLLQEQPIALVLIFLVIMGTVLFIGRNLLFKSFDTKYMPLIIMGIIVISILLVSIFLVYVNTPIF